MDANVLINKYLLSNWKRISSTEQTRFFDHKAQQENVGLEFWIIYLQLNFKCTLG